VEKAKNLVKDQNLAKDQRRAKERVVSLAKHQRRVKVEKARSLAKDLKRAKVAKAKSLARHQRKAKERVERRRNPMNKQRSIKGKKQKSLKDNNLSRHIMFQSRIVEKLMYN
jgi:hypothetical protein